ncbi:MAG: alpha/beta hydrolase [Anaerolineae bacterium]|nr:alpha/beta hydrolase [Anaerolineae bacterium]
MTNWQPYESLYPQHTVTGSVQVYPALHSPQLGNERSLLVYLPPSYAASDRRYPVLYMHDGQNLFDEHTSYAGEWRVDETMEALSHEGLEAIVVGIPNAGERRVHEYSPFADSDSEGQGALYMRFMVETVKPLIDSAFRTLPGREHTGLAGSSMGGLISLYGFIQHPAVFGAAGVISPAFWFGELAIFPFVEQAAFVPGKIWMDVGTQEGDAVVSQAYLEGARRMRRILLAKGYREGETLRYLEDEGGIHNEADWARRLPDIVRFLVGK